jgi:hypothetical protein
MPSKKPYVWGTKVKPSSVGGADGFALCAPTIYVAAYRPSPSVRANQDVTKKQEHIILGEPSLEIWNGL